MQSQSSPEGAFGGWSSLGGYVTQITVGTDRNGDLTVFGIGSDHAAWYRKQHSATNLSFDRWNSLGGYVNQLAQANQGNGDLDLFAIGSDSGAWFRHENAP